MGLCVSNEIPNWCPDLPMPDADDMIHISKTWLSCCKEAPDRKDPFKFFIEKVHILIDAQQPEISHKIVDIDQVVAKYISIIIHRTDTHDAPRDIAIVARGLKKHGFDPQWFRILGSSIIGAIRVCMLPNAVMSIEDDKSWNRAWSYILHNSVKEFAA